MYQLSHIYPEGGEVLQAEATNWSGTAMGGLRLVLGNTDFLPATPLTHDGDKLGRASREMLGRTHRWRREHFGPCASRMLAREFERFSDGRSQQRHVS